MVETFELKGTFSQQTAASLRSHLAGVQVVVVSGITGERILKVIGALTTEQLRQLREAVLRLLKADQVSELTIGKDRIVIRGVPADRLEEVKDSALALLQGLHAKSVRS